MDCSAQIQDGVELLNRAVDTDTHTYIDIGTSALPLHAHSSPILGDSAPTQRPQPQSADPKLALATYHQNLAAHLNALIHTARTPSPAIPTTSSIAPAPTTKPQHARPITTSRVSIIAPNGRPVPPTAPPSTHKTIIPPENPRQKSDSSLESSLNTFAESKVSSGVTDHWRSGQSSARGSIETAPTSVDSSDVKAAKQIVVRGGVDALRGVPVTSQLTQGSSGSGREESNSSGSQPGADKSRRSSRSGSGSVEGNVSKDSKKPASPPRGHLARSTSSTNSLQYQLDLTARPEYQPRFSPLLLVDQGTTEQESSHMYSSGLVAADGASSSQAGPSRPRRSKTAILTSASGSASYDVPLEEDATRGHRADLTSPGDQFASRSTTAEKAVDPVNSSPSSSQMPIKSAASSSTREEEQRKAWETDGRRVWKHLPDGFELKLGASPHSQAHLPLKSRDSSDDRGDAQQSTASKTQHYRRQNHLDTASMSDSSHSYHGSNTRGSSAAGPHSDSNERSTSLSLPMERGHSIAISSFSASGHSELGGTHARSLTPSQAASARRPASRLNTDSDSASRTSDAKRSSMHAHMHADTELRASSRNSKGAANHTSRSSPQRDSTKLRVVNPDAEEDEQDDDEEHAGGGANAVEEDDDPGVKAYRAKRDAKLRKKEATLRLKVARWWQGVQDAMPAIEVTTPPPIEPSLPSPSLVKALLRFPELAAEGSDLYAISTSLLNTNLEALNHAERLRTQQLRDESHQLGDYASHSKPDSNLVSALLHDASNAVGLRQQHPRDHQHHHFSREDSQKIHHHHRSTQHPQSYQHGHSLVSKQYAQHVARQPDFSLNLLGNASGLSRHLSSSGSGGRATPMSTKLQHQGKEPWDKDVTPKKPHFPAGTTDAGSSGIDHHHGASNVNHGDNALPPSSVSWESTMPTPKPSLSIKGEMDHGKDMLARLDRIPEAQQHQALFSPTPTNPAQSKVVGLGLDGTGLNLA